MIGITLTPELDCEAAHAKNDDDVTNDKKLTVDNIAIIVKHDSGWYQKELLKREKNAARLKSIAP
jgi:hypothetical protein